MRAFVFGLAAFSLLCIGVHTAADVLDDRIASGVEVIDVALDGFFARFEWTRGLVDVIDAALITRFGRAIALVWELLIDVMLGRQVFAYERRKLDADRLSAIVKQVAHEARRAQAMGGKRAVVFLRPAFAAIFVLTGAAAVGRLVQGSVALTLKLRGLGQIAGLLVLGACLVVLGVDAVAAAFGRARDEKPSNMRREIVMAAIVMPLAWLALSEALSLGGFVQ